jgi:putative CocE/NonD family hydrolase
MECRDGTHLVSRIWEPAATGGIRHPLPALLMRQPYGRAIASTITYAHPRWYASHGFLVVVQDVRGRGESEGRFGGFAQEARDGTDCLRWLRSLPECNGKVGCYGFSYQGLTQLLWEDPRELPDCLVPAMAGPDERHHWASSGGAHWWALGLAWGMQLAAQECQRQGDQAGWQELRDSLDSGRFLREGPQLLERHAPQGMALEWLRRDASSTAGWRRHPLCSALAGRPMLLVGGWHDPHLEGILDLWHWASQAGTEPWLRIGAWNHLNWAGQLDELQLSFFRHHLQGMPPAPELQVRVAMADSRTGIWRHQAAEPGSGAHPPSRVWQLLAPANLVPAEQAQSQPDGVEFPAPRSAESWLDLVHDPWRAVPGRGGHLGLDAGPCERGDLDRRNDVLCFTSAPLGSPLSLEGRPRLTVRAMADQPGFDLCVALSVVSAAGTSVLQLVTGVARFTGSSCLEQRLRDVQLQPLSTHLQTGERLRLSIAAAAWPQIAVNPGSGERCWGGPSALHRIITVSMALADARLELFPLPVPGAQASIRPEGRAN